MGVAFGCGLMTFLFSVAAGMEYRMERTFNEVSGRIIISRQDAIFGGMFLGMDTGSIPADYVDIVEGVPHVVNVSKQVAAILRPREANFVMPFFGYEESDLLKLQGAPYGKLVAGSIPVNDNEAIIGKNLVEYMTLLDVSYDVGGLYTFLVSPNREITLKIVGVYQSGNEIMDGGIMGTDEFVRAMGRIGKAWNAFMAGALPRSGLWA